MPLLRLALRVSLRRPFSSLPSSFFRVFLIFISIWIAVGRFVVSDFYLIPFDGDSRWLRLSVLDWARPTAPPVGILLFIIVNSI